MVQGMTPSKHSGLIPVKVTHSYRKGYADIIAFA